MPNIPLADNITTSRFTAHAHQKLSNAAGIRRFYSLPIVWVLSLVLLVFASQYGFSFERGAINSDIGAASQGLISAIDSQQSMVLRLQSYGVYILSILIVVPLGKLIWRDALRFRHISILPLLACSSILWSQNIKATAASSLYLILNFALAFYINRRFSPNEVMKLLMVVGTIAAVSTLAMVFFFPQYGLQTRGSYAAGAWQGIFGQKNLCGTEMTTLLTPAFFVRFESRNQLFFRSLYIATLLLIIAMTRSTGAFAISFVCIGFVIILGILSQLRPLDRVIFLIASVSVAVASALVVYQFRDNLLTSVGKDPTLTGRTLIWTALLTSIAKRPFLGYGYMAFWNGLTGESANVIIASGWVGIGYAENGILELVIQLGLVGLLTFLTSYFIGLLAAMKSLLRKPPPYVKWYATILFLLAVSNVEGGKILFPSDLGSIVLTISMLGLASYARAVQPQDQKPAHARQPMKT